MDSGPSSGSLAMRQSKARGLGRAADRGGRSLGPKNWGRVWRGALEVLPGQRTRAGATVTRLPGPCWPPAGPSERWGWWVQHCLEWTRAEKIPGHSSLVGEGPRHMSTDHTAGSPQLPQAPHGPFVHRGAPATPKSLCHWASLAITGGCGCPASFGPCSDCVVGLPSCGLGNTP